MKVFITKQFDNRKVGTCIDLHDSTAGILIKKGIVSETAPMAVEETPAVEETQAVETVKPKYSQPKTK